MAIYRKKKFTSHKKVGGPEIGAATRAKKWAGRGPSSPIGSAANVQCELQVYQTTMVEN